jgi:purine-binding chemotaxis protein CheW
VTGERPRIDWEEVHARIARARRALDEAGASSPEEVHRILRERARAVAQPLGAPATTDDSLQLLVIALAGERYGIELARILDVFPLRELTPVPCTPPFVLGVINHRGHVLSVLDLRRLFDLAGQGVAAESRVVAVEVGQMRVGLYGDAVEGIVEVAAGEISPASTVLGGAHQVFLEGVTRDMLGVLDPDALARDSRIAVNDKAG